ncbi:IgG-binding virulence factor TspB family protein [Neisseria mucosa]|uniref:IgG-binding virulence factor TspB family protein n=1 Tax=Neisseria mucosa TaxID=488 RepID=UPI0027E0E4D1|nr:IgG-binding virulence factor TspB family protein [Neisseria mucosa]
MKNDKRSGIFIGFTAAPLRCAVLLCFSAGNTIVPLTAFADVGLPPPAQHQSSGFPSEKALEQKGYNPKTGVWRVQSQNNGRPTVTKDGGTIKGTQGKTVTVTGKYGEKGVMHTTQTQGVNIGKVEKIAGGTLAALTAAGGAIGSDFAARAYLSAKNGDWGGAAREGLGAVLEGLSKLDITDFGKGVNQFLDKTRIRPNSSSGQLTQAAQQAATAQAQAEQGGNLGGAMAAAAAKKAAEGAAKAAKQAEGWTTSGKMLAEASKNKDGSYSQLYLRRIDIRSGSNVNPKPEIQGYRWQIDKYNGIYNWSYAKYATWYKGSLPEGYDSVSGAIYTPITNDAQLQDARAKVSGKTPAEQQQTIKDMTLNQQDIKDILSRMLNNQQTNHAELMNQLAKIGDAVEKSTESNQFTPMTADSAPYTPQGSNTPQQTRFTLNADGSVSTSIVPRPDLKPNSTLAPTRSEIVPNPNKGQDNPTIPTKPNNAESPNKQTTPSEQSSPNAQQNQGQNQANRQNENQQGLLCQVFPNIAACADLGESDYEDVQIPENSIDLGSLKPIDYFSTNGQCPAPASFQLGALGSFDFDYSYVCRVAETIRPIVILGTIIICSWMAYSAVKEL